MLLLSKLFGDWMRFDIGRESFFLERANFPFDERYVCVLSQSFYVAKARK
jgi:hypothetical protein